MKKGKKILIILAVVFILTGSAMMAGAWLHLLDKVSEKNATMEFHETTHTHNTITDPFSDIIINTQNSSVEILPSPDSICRIVCDDSEKMYHTVSFQRSEDGSVILITQHNEWKWYETLGGLHWQEDPMLTIYLPKSEYRIVDIISGSGDITIAPDFRFRTLSTCAISGNTKLSDLEADNLIIRSTSGDISLRGATVTQDAHLDNISGFTRAEHVTAAKVTTSATSGNTALEYITSVYLRACAVSGQIIIYDSSFSDTSHFETGSGSIEIANSDCGGQTTETTSGFITLQNVRGRSLNVSTSSGEISLWDTLYSGNVLCHTISSEIMFTGLDGDNLEFITSSGGVSGDLLSGKNFITETTSGYVQVPPSDESAGTCHISTVSGNISIALEP